MPFDLRTDDREVNIHKRARQELIDGLRAVAAFYEENPHAHDDGMTVVLSMYVPGQAAGRILAMMESALGICTKNRTREYCSVAKSFSSRVKLEFFTRTHGQAGGTEAGDLALRCRCRLATRRWLEGVFPILKGRYFGCRR